MKSTKKLSLKRERLTELTTDELQHMAGGVATPTCLCDPTYTATCECTQGCPSDNTQCGSLDTCTCDCTFRNYCNVAIQTFAL